MSTPSERPQIGDIVLVSGHARDETPWARALDWAIDWATDGPYHHAALVGDGHLLEALWHVQESPLGRYVGISSLFHVQATAEQRKAAVAWMQARVGQRYGIASLLEDGLRSIAHVSILPRAAPHRFTCSGIIAAAYLQAGVTLTYRPLPSPMDLANSPVLLGKRPWVPTP